MWTVVCTDLVQYSKYLATCGWAEVLLYAFLTLKKMKVRCWCHAPAESSPGKPTGKHSTAGNAAHSGLCGPSGLWREDTNHTIPHPITTMPFYGWYSLATSPTPTLRHPATLQQSAVRVFSNARKYFAVEDGYSGSVTGDKLFWIRKQLLASEQGVVSYTSYPVPHTSALSGLPSRECHSAWTTSSTGRLAARITDSRGSQPGISQFRSMNIPNLMWFWPCIVVNMWK